MCIVLVRHQRLVEDNVLMLNADPVFVVLLSSVGEEQSARAAAGGGSGNRIQL